MGAAGCVGAEQLGSALCGGKAALATDLWTRSTAPGFRPGGRVTFFWSRPEESHQRRCAEPHAARPPRPSPPLRQAFVSRVEASRCALAADLSSPDGLEPVRRPTRGCTPCSRAIRMQRRSGGAVLGFALTPSGVGVQPRLSPREGAMAGARHKSTARAQRLASSLTPGTLDQAGAQWLLNWRLFFGDFLLARQKKVTRPRGADSRGGAPSCKDSRQEQPLKTAGSSPKALRTSTPTHPAG